MSKVFKLTKEQIKRINEDGMHDFIFFGDSDVKHYNGNVEISVSGKLDTCNNGEPITGDDFSKSITNNHWYRFSNGKRFSNGVVSEDRTIDNELDTLSDGEEEDDLEVIPKSVDSKVEQFIDFIKNGHLSHKQNAMILNKLIEELPITDTTYSWKSQLSMKLKQGTV